jgi:hypothetical protein
MSIFFKDCQKSVCFVGRVFETIPHPHFAYFEWGVSESQKTDVL